MKRVDKKAELLKKLQNELDIRTQVKKEAIRLISNGECEKACALLNALDDSIVKEIEHELDQLDEKMNSDNWISVNLPEDCPNVCISFKKEIAEMQTREFGARPLYGFDSRKEDWLPVEIFITYGGWLAPDQRLQET